MKAIPICMMSIKEMRKITRLTQQEFAYTLSIPKRTIEDWETGKRKPPEYIINLIAYYIQKES